MVYQQIYLGRFSEALTNLSRKKAVPLKIFKPLIDKRLKLAKNFNRSRFCAGCFNDRVEFHS